MRTDATHTRGVGIQGGLAALSLCQQLWCSGVRRWTERPDQPVRGTRLPPVMQTRDACTLLVSVRRRPGRVTRWSTHVLSNAHSHLAGQQPIHSPFSGRVAQNSETGTVSTAPRFRFLLKQARHGDTTPVGLFQNRIHKVSMQPCPFHNPLDRSKKLRPCVSGQTTISYIYIY